MSEERPLPTAPTETAPATPQVSPNLSPDSSPDTSLDTSLDTSAGTPPAPSLFEPNRALGLGLLPDDLPYVNEVDAALHRGAGKGTVRLSLVIGLFMVALLLWAALADIDEVTHAEGQVIASQRTQVIQNLEGGILRAVLVDEGGIVEKGDVLAQLDNEMAASSHRDALGKTVDHALALIRLEAELSRNEPLWPEDVSLWLRQVVGPSLGAEIPADVLAQAHESLGSQQGLLQAHTAQRGSELRLLQAQQEQRVQEVREMQTRLGNLERSLVLAKEQRSIASQLHGRGSYSRAEYLNVQQQEHQAQSELDSLKQALPRAEAAARESGERIAFRQAELDAALADEASKRRQELASLRETLNAGSDRVTRTELRSPVRGTVKRIAITTVGGVVKPGEPIMEIVPLDDALLIEARVRPADVAFLRPKQQAMVKISAYDFAIFGGLPGELVQISADTLEDKRGDTYYLAKIRTQGTSIVYQNESLPIIPGMVATVDILTGKKTVLDYILKPILKARQRALRER